MRGLTCADACSGPVISPDAKTRIEKLIQSVDDEGGKILLDGRGVKVQGYPNGNWVGPTVVECTTDMSAYKSVRIARSAIPDADPCDRNEIFGPVLTLISADTLDDAIEIINANK